MNLDELKKEMLDLHPNEHIVLLETIFDMFTELEDANKLKHEFFELIRFLTEDDEEPRPHLKRIK